MAEDAPWWRDKFVQTAIFGAVLGFAQGIAQDRDMWEQERQERLRLEQEQEQRRVNVWRVFESALNVVRGWLQNNSSSA